MKKRKFGKNKAAKETSLYMFENANGIKMEVTDLGATLVRLLVPDKNGLLRDVVLGYDGAQEYESGSGTFFGATVGRNANRIGKAEIVINGISYELDKNDGENNLHSGLDFYSFRVWDVKNIGENNITFSLNSPDMDQGYPGEVQIDVTYTLTEDNQVRIDYLAVPEEDTIINLTNHSYFNLDGHDSGNVLAQQMWIDADSFTETDACSIPTGKIRQVENTPMDFRQKKTIGAEINAEYEAVILGRGYDHNWCLNNDGKFAKVAELTSEESGITMEVYTDLPGVQIYTANYVENETGKDGVVYEKRQGVCFETQYYPDALHHENFQSPVFGKEKLYRTTTAFKFL